MCIACEMAMLMALDDLPDEPPPGFPRPRRTDRRQISPATRRERQTGMPMRRRKVRTSASRE